MDKTGDPVAELSNTTIPQMTATLNSVQKTADRLNALTFEIQQNPKALLTSNGGREVEIPQ